MDRKEQMGRSSVSGDSEGDSQQRAYHDVKCNGRQDNVGFRVVRLHSKKKSVSSHQTMECILLLASQLCLSVYRK